MSIPLLGKTVLYTLTDDDAGKIKLARDIEAPLGRRGNPVAAGQQCPATIVRTWGTTPGSAFNIQLHLDGNDTHWLTSVAYGGGRGFCQDTTF